MWHPINIPGAFSEGFNMNVLPHVIAIGNICGEFSSSENMKSVETTRSKNSNDL